MTYARQEVGNETQDTGFRTSQQISTRICLLFSNQLRTKDETKASKDLESLCQYCHVTLDCRRKRTDDREVDVDGADDRAEKGPENRAFIDAVEEQHMSYQSNAAEKEVKRLTPLGRHPVRTGCR